MLEPGDLETYEEEAVEAVDLEHVLCGMCEDEPSTYLCGTPRDPFETIVEMPEPHTLPDCVVCFGGDSLTCNNCGSEIQCPTP